MCSSDESPAKRPRSAPDLKIVVDDGELEVHSVILEYASPVFAKMLSSAMKEGSGTSIQLPGKKFTELDTFYKELQLCTMKPLTKETAIFLTHWAEEYQVDSLKDKCEAYLLASVPVTGQALHHAVKYGVHKRTKQCLDVMKGDLAKHVNDLEVLTEKGCEEHLKQMWPLILREGGLQPSPLPPAEHVKSMWPFVAHALRTAPRLRQLVRLKGECASWQIDLMVVLPCSHSADEKAKTWLTEKLRAHGLPV